MEIVLESVRELLFTDGVSRPCRVGCGPVR